MTNRENEGKMLVRRSMSADHLIVITTKRAVDATVWRRYVQRHWDKLIWRKSRVLALAGVHGRADGKIGPPSEDFLRWNRSQARLLREENASFIREHQVSIDVLDVRPFIGDGNVILEKDLAEAIREKSPTVIVLTFCYTKKSVINQILADAGIYSELFLQRGDKRQTSPWAN